MSNLVKIKEVLLYVGYTANAQKCYLLKKFLDDNNIKYTLMNYADEAHHKAVFDSMNTWRYGAPGETDYVNITDFPFITWKGYFDDFETGVFIAFDENELLANPYWTKYLIE